MAKDTKEQVKNFKATGEEPVRIGLTSGHVMHISNTEWTPTPKRFWSHAYALGCDSEDMTDKVTTSRPETLDARKEKIMTAIDSMVQAAEKDDLLKAESFTKAGSPDINVLSTKLGFSIKSQERDLLWEEYPEWAGKRQASKGKTADLNIEDDGDSSDDDIKD